jgi:hypothetical protein
MKTYIHLFVKGKHLGTSHIYILGLVLIDLMVSLLTNVACAVGPSVTASSIDISFQNFVFWNLFQFLVAKIISKSTFPTF